MSKDRNNYAGTHLSAGFYFPSYQYIVAKAILPHFELFAYFSTIKLENHSHMFFLESLTGDENARYSILGYHPRLLLESREKQVSISENCISHKVVEMNIFSALRAVLQAQPPEHIVKAGHFCGGPVGYWGYDLALQNAGIGVVNRPLPALPDSAFFLPGIVVVQDRHTSLFKVYGFYRPDKNDEQNVRNQVQSTIQDIIGASQIQALEEDTPKKALDLTFPQGQSGASLQESTSGYDEGEFASNTTRHDFLEMVGEVQEHIRRGNIFQAVISQRWKKRTRAGPGEVYARLRISNPSPYMFYLQFPEFTLLGSSPEMLVKVEEDKVQTRPIAGTRPVTRDKARNAVLRRELIEDAKERAEHLMLVDLGRNDAGKVSQPGTVAVKEFMKVEAYSHVVHLVSVIEGQLKTGEDSLSALQACFPAGTLTGAPKRRAMEIIDQLEKDRRGPYGGAVGYLGLNGCLDSCITIRSILFRHGWCYLQAGAGIVADSSPDSEYLETINKAMALMDAILDAEGSL